jgi:hypothetical protein
VTAEGVVVRDLRSADDHCGIADIDTAAGTGADRIRKAPDGAAETSGAPLPCTRLPVSIIT